MICIWYRIIIFEDRWPNTLERHAARYQMAEMIEGHKFTNHSILSLCFLDSMSFAFIAASSSPSSSSLSSFSLNIYAMTSRVFSRECLCGMGGGEKQSEKPNQVLVFAFFFAFEDCVFLSTLSVCVYMLPCNVYTPLYGLDRSLRMHVMLSIH